MTDLLLNFFGLPTTDVTNVARWSLAFYGLNPLYILLTAAFLCALVILMYRRAANDISPFRRYTLAFLRCAFLILILLMLLRPVLSVTLESNVRRTLLILFDTSASMSDIKDQRTDANDLKRAAIAKNILDPAKGLNQPLANTANLSQLPRLDLVKSILKNPRLNLLPTLAKDYDLAAFTFDKSLADLPAASYREGEAPAEPRQVKPAPSDSSFIIHHSSLSPNAPWIDNLRAQGPYTAIGDSIAELLSKKRGQPLAGILLLTDGANNSGSQPTDAANLAARDKLPLFIYAVGITSPKDIIVSSIFAPEIAFANDQVPITVRLRASGLAGQSAKLAVYLAGDKSEKDITFTTDPEQLFTLTLTPKQKGDFEIRATIPPRDDEVVKDNNTATQRIRIIDGKIKVLYLEQFPRWEYKYLQAILARDRRIDPKFILLESDPAISHAPNSPFLSEFPRKNEDLFKFDVLILGDVDPKTFSPTQLDAINQFVSKFGGSLITLAGKRFTPNAYRSTTIAKMLPVELESMLDSSLLPAAAKPINIELTPAGKSNTMLRLAEKELDSFAAWAKLPQIYFVNKVARAKPAAEVLAVDPDPAKASRFGKMPIIALQQYGLGQVLYLGTDNLWRIRKNTADRHHTMLWSQIVQRMALPHLLGASKRTQLTSDQKTYTTGARITLFARLYTEAFEPMTDAAVRGSCSIANSDALPRDVLLRPLPDRPGMYRGELIAPAPGNCTFTVEHDKTTKLEFAVTDPKQELAETAMNESLLRQMAQTTAGAFFREEDLHTLPAKIGSKTERLESTREVELWSSPFYLLLLFSIVTLEWILRKIAQLK